MTVYDIRSPIQSGTMYVRAKAVDFQAIFVYVSQIYTKQVQTITLFIFISLRMRNFRPEVTRKMEVRS